MNVHRKEMRKRERDGERLNFAAEVIPVLRQVVERGEVAFFENGGRNVWALSALQGMTIVFQSLSELSDAIKQSEKALDWDLLTARRNYFAHEYLHWDMPAVWADLQRYTPLLEDAVPRLVQWDKEHPMPKLREPTSLKDVRREDARIQEMHEKNPNG